MRIVQTIARVEQEASGPTYSVTRLAGGLQALGHDVRLMSIGGVAPGLEIPTPHQRFRQDHARFPVLKSLLLSGGFDRAIRDEARAADIVHAHGLWLMPNIYPSWAAAAAATPLVISPRGTFSPVALQRSRLRKRLFWTLLQARAVGQAACLHATSDQEHRDIRAAGLRQPVAVIPNGVDIPEPAPAGTQGDARTLLYLGRIHPIKGLEVLLDAWSRVSGDFPDWRLRLVGPDSDGYEAALKAKAEQLHLQRVQFAGSRYGAAKAEEYGAAELYVLPSFTENFGMSVAEAMAHGLPVITTTGTPWEAVRARCSGWWASPDAAGLEAALRDALGRPPQALREMGEAGRRWMAESFSWRRVAADMARVYEWICGEASPPDLVRFD